MSGNIVALTQIACRRECLKGTSFQRPLAGQGYVQIPQFISPKRDMCCKCCQNGDRLKGKGTSFAIHHRMRDFGEMRFPDDWMQEDQKCIQICQALLEKSASKPQIIGPV